MTYTVAGVCVPFVKLTVGKRKSAFQYLKYSAVVLGKFRFQPIVTHGRHLSRCHYIKRFGFFRQLNIRHYGFCTEHFRKRYNALQIAVFVAVNIKLAAVIKGKHIIAGIALVERAEVIARSVSLAIRIYPPDYHIV